MLAREYLAAVSFRRELALPGVGPLSKSAPELAPGAHGDRGRTRRRSGRLAVTLLSFAVASRANGRGYRCPAAGGVGGEPRARHPARARDAPRLRGGRRIAAGR